LKIYNTVLNNGGTHAQAMHAVAQSNYASVAGTLTTGMAVIAGRCYGMLDFARRM
jgi:hypothetical protein